MLMVSLCVLACLQGFSPSLFEHFVQPDGRKYPYPVVQTFKDSTGRLVDMIVTPQVVEQARHHLGCATLQGAALEGEGGEGSSGAHWEYRLFQVSARQAVCTGAAGPCVMYCSSVLAQRPREQLDVPCRFMLWYLQHCA
jgi:hypothetical protein